MQVGGLCTNADAPVHGSKKTSVVPGITGVIQMCALRRVLFVDSAERGWDRV